VDNFQLGLAVIAVLVPLTQLKTVRVVVQEYFLIAQGKMIIDPIVNVKKPPFLNSAHSRTLGGISIATPFLSLSPSNCFVSRKNWFKTGETTGTTQRKRTHNKTAQKREYMYKRRPVLKSSVAPMVRKTFCIRVSVGMGRCLLRSMNRIINTKEM
jgi:hypothetical protein